MSIFNNPELREITISSASVTATARGMAKLYDILANGGTLGEKSLLSADVLAKLYTPLVSGLDAVTQTPDVKFGPGMSIKENPKVSVTDNPMPIISQLSEIPIDFHGFFFVFSFTDCFC